jgi:hypothetical protein
MHFPVKTPQFKYTYFQWELWESNRLIVIRVFSCHGRKVWTHKNIGRSTKSYTRISLQSYGTYFLKLNIGSESYCRRGWKFFYFPSLPHACSLLPHNKVGFHFGIQKRERFYFYHNVRTFFRVNNAPYSVVKAALSLGIKRPVCGADHSSPSRAEVKNEWSHLPRLHMPSWFTRW